MKLKKIFLCLSLLSVGLAYGSTYSLLDNDPPSTEEIANAEAAYGKDLITATFLHIGPEVQDESMRYAGNNYACTNCHQEDATKPYAMPWTGLSKVKNREAIIESIDNCFTTNMAGKSLPIDSKELKSILSYIDYLSQDVPSDTTEIEGLGLNPVTIPGGIADIDEGEELYTDSCEICHGPQGQGIRLGVAGDSKGYSNPPIWGKDSFSKESSFNDVNTLAKYIYNNMPSGADHEDPIFEEDEVRDIATYILSRYNESR